MLKSHRFDRLISLFLLIIIGSLVPSGALASEDSVRIQDAPWDMTCAAWSPDGKLLAVCHEEDILLYSVDLKVLSTLKGHTKTVTSLSWKSDSSLLASGSNDTTVRIWDIQTRKTISIYRGHTEAITHVRWSPDGKTIASTSASEISGENPSWQIFEPLSATYKYKFDTNMHKTKYQHFIRSIAWNPNGNQIAAGDQINGVGIWDIPSGEVALKIADEATINDIAWSPDGERIAVVGGNPGEPGYFSIWSAKTGKLLSKLDGHSTWIMSVAWSPDGSQIATASQDQTIKIWNGSTGRVINTLPLPNPDEFIWPDFISWSPDSKQIAWTIGKKEVCIWSTRSKENARCVGIGSLS